ncbi:MAG: type II toxin-antitoxin system RelE/ParE family toxin [Candidatus Latescibacterota bacterium]
MIVSFHHKGLERFFRTGSTAGIQPEQAARLRLIITVLNRARSLSDVALPGLRLHALHGDRQGSHAVSVSADWRIVFRLTQGEVSNVDLTDYH